MEKIDLDHRIQCVNQLAIYLMGKKEAFVTLIVEEMGKPIQQARTELTSYCTL